MKALVLNGARAKNDAIDVVCDSALFVLSRNNFEVDVVSTRDEKIALCLGCFGAWIKTPGTCVINDAGVDWSKKFIQSDLTVILTPIVFGMYSSQVKKLLDRLPCPYLLPFFQKMAGEVHHKRRYEKCPTIVGIGVLPSPNAEMETVFETLVSRNAVNMHTKAFTKIVYSTDPLELVKEKVTSTLSLAGVN